MTEQAGPRDLVAHATAGEEAGFDSEVMSDHYFPWLDEQRHSPYAGSVLGAVTQASATTLRWVGRWRALCSCSRAAASPWDSAPERT